MRSGPELRMSERFTGRAVEGDARRMMDEIRLSSMVSEE
jgi:hypothetical protein